MLPMAHEADRPAAQVFQKPILTSAEAAEMLGISLQKFRRLDIPRYVLSSRVQWYLVDDLIEWVRQLPQYGEMPSDRMPLHTQVLVV